MSERQPSEEQLSQEFEILSRNFILRVMAQQGWARQTDGHPASPTGWFARISNYRDDVDSIYSNFWYETELLGPEDWSVMLGHFVLREWDGMVKVKRYETEREAINRFNKLQRKHIKWMGK